MQNVNWKDEVNKRQEDLLHDTKKMLQIKSILDEENAVEGAPFGTKVKEALDFLLDLGSSSGMKVKNLDGYAGHLEIGEGDDLIGVLCHIDVVPEGDGWSVDPFGGEVKEGKIFARGAIDDKGPTMAAFYGMKIIQELKLPLSKRVRLIIGADEESDWRCVDHYFKHEEMPSMGFAPDADFPIINAEKGIIDVMLSLQAEAAEVSDGSLLLSFSSGRRLNMVPDAADASIQTEDAESVLQAFSAFLKEENLQGNGSSEGGTVKLRLEGVSAHGSTPEQGVNAGTKLARFLSKYVVSGSGAVFIQLVSEGLSEDHYGMKLGIDEEDEASGKLTVNPGMMEYNHDKEAKVGLNIRFPVTHKGEKTIEKLKNNVKEDGWNVFVKENKAPNYVEESHVLVQTLKKVYEEQTGKEGELIAIGGGTYARSLKAGVAFGALFPGRKDVAHQKDEHMFVDDLFQAAAIYAQAIYELAK
ncbi:dipeptidase PepV [Fictibacillus aquaticus]|uniref:Dipeptidase PepV n=1 Tax=Fictibacillus aquaticus TaxID=2021314 RepID=A0A235FBF7_9BACL|nr:dipeptidase PepV [Fictibacillus aquaticus]OYD58263.1 dipeptidase PepV [Fictibacillus aquaticus]